MNKQFKFSIIMAVYNVQDYIREAVESLLNQTLDFKTAVQLILVDDGSLDQSGKICDEFAEQYPENIRVIHKTNGGQASARTEGLKYATGQYVNFMDSDDRLSLTALEKVYDFFCQNESLSVVSIPMNFFDASKGEHWQNYKFENGSRVIDLRKDYTALAMSVASSFYPLDKIKKMSFDTTLVTGEDMKFNLTLFSDVPMLGVVSEAIYWYRRRSGENLSTVQSSVTKKAWYFEYFYNLVFWAFKYYEEKWGYIPQFIQYHIASDLQWRFKENFEENARLNLSENDFIEYKKILFEVLVFIDDEIIMSLKRVAIEHKVFMLRKKYHQEPQIAEREGRQYLTVNGWEVCDVSKNSTVINFLNIDKERLEVEGYVSSLWPSREETKVYLSVDTEQKEYMECESVEREIQTTIFGESLANNIPFKCVIQLEGIKKMKIGFVCVIQDHYINMQNLKFSRFCPIGAEFKNSFSKKGAWILTLNKTKVEVYKSSFFRQIFQIYKFGRDLWKEKQKKAVIALMAHHILCVFIRKEIWLISDREDMAGDNGEALFLYLKEKPIPNVKPFFVLSEKSKDYVRLKQIGAVIPYGTYKHKMVHLLAKYIISSQAEISVINPFGRSYVPYRNILSKHRFVFLQHGVLGTDLSEWLNRYNKNIYGFITTAYPEYQAILRGKYFYSEKEVWLTGLARYDRLYHDEKKYITVMPTWRKYLRDVPGVFESSDWFKFYRALLTNENLLEAIKRKNYKLCLKPHPNMLKFLDFFSDLSEVEVLDETYDYRKILAESNLVISDYSSVTTDFSYLKKPVIYCQFDKEEFFSGGHMCQPGDFDYERDGFGEVTYTLEDTVNCILGYINNDCHMKEIYKKRADQFFAYRDQANCKRICERILES